MIKPDKSSINYPFLRNLFLVIVPILFFLWNCSDTFFIQDDAFTSLRYVINFVDGNGLVFNLGERVEGYTNFLWVLLLSGIALVIKTLNFLFNLGINLKHALELATQILSISFSISLIAAVYFLSNKQIQSSEVKEYRKTFIAKTLTFVLLIALVFTTPFVYWGVSGMETSLFAALILLSIHVYCYRKEEKDLKPFMIISLFNSLLRPEGIILFGAIAIYHLSQIYYSKEELHFKKRIALTFNIATLKPFMVYFVPFVSYTVFRLVYYGYPFPNTYYAKTEFSVEFIERGAYYIYNFAKAYLLYGAIIPPIIFVLIKQKLDKNEKLFLWIVIVWFAYILFIGGDVLPIYRFFIPVLPLIYFLFLRSIVILLEEFIAKDVLRITSFSFIGIAIISYSVFNYSNYKNEMMEKRGYEIGLVSKMKIYAEFMNEKIVKNKSVSGSKNVSVAMSTIGAFSYYSGTKVIDLVGLTDEYTAHNPKETLGIDEDLPVLWKERRYNADYVFFRKPDYIIFPAGAKPSAFAECAVFVHPNFYNHYYMQIFYSEELRQLLPVFTRKENIRKDSLQNCNNRFLINYINANNIFLKMLETKNRNLLNLMNRQLDEMLKKCPNRISEVYTLKGMAFYHLKLLVIAKSFLEKAVLTNSSNSIANYYLMNTYNLLGQKELALKTLAKVLKNSPYAIANSFE